MPALPHTVKTGNRRKRYCSDRHRAATEARVTSVSVIGSCFDSISTCRSGCLLREGGVDVTRFCPQQNERFPFDSL